MRLLNHGKRTRLINAVRARQRTEYRLRATGRPWVAGTTIGMVAVGTRHATTGKETTSLLYPGEAFRFGLVVLRKAIAAWWDRP